jgi:hypothetical protein
MMGDKMFTERILKALRSDCGLEEDDKSKDIQNIRIYSPKEAFRVWLNYEGIIGYDYTILSVIDELFDTCLTDDINCKNNFEISYLYHVENLLGSDYSEECVERIWERIVKETFTTDKDIFRIAEEERAKNNKD